MKNDSIDTTRRFPYINLVESGVAYDALPQPVNFVTAIIPECLIR